MKTKNRVANFAQNATLSTTGDWNTRPPTASSITQNRGNVNRRKTK